MSLACLAHVNFLLHMYFDLITEQINDDDDDDVLMELTLNARAPKCGQLFPPHSCCSATCDYACV